MTKDLVMFDRKPPKGSPRWMMESWSMCKQSMDGWVRVGPELRKEINRLSAKDKFEQESA